jgi:hypothetical protein
MAKIDRNMIAIRNRFQPAIVKRDAGALLSRTSGLEYYMLVNFVNFSETGFGWVRSENFGNYQQLSAFRMGLIGFVTKLSY